MLHASRVFASLAFLFATTGWTGCATTGGAGPGAATVTGTPHRGPPIRSADDVTVEPLRTDQGEAGEAMAFVDGRSGKALTWDEVVSRAQSADVTLVGEQHDNPTHHALQARVIRAVASKHGAVAVALEMVPNHLQASLDRYNRGEIDAEGMAEALDWQTTWGHDFELYRPIFDAGREVSAVFVAVNAPRPLVRAVAQKGIDGLDGAERAKLPQLDLSDAEHKASIREVFENHHPPTGAGSKGFDRFYAAQVLWDESMADGAARALVERGKVVVLAGNGHVGGYRGIPNRLLRRAPDAKVLTIVPISVDADEDPEAEARSAIAAGVGDILAIIPPRPVLSI